MNNNELWTQILSRIESSVSSMIYNVYFKDTTLLNIDNNNTLKIQVKNEFIMNHLLNHFDDLINDVIKEVTNKEYLYELVLPSADVEVPKKKDDNEVITQLPLDNVDNSVDINNINDTFNDNLIPRYTFDTFMVGKQNAVAYTCAQAVAEKPGVMYNPLFIYGKSGLGKTHLMHAIGNEIKKKWNKRVLYISSKQFKEDYQEIFANRETNKTLLDAFKKKYYDIDVLIIDDIQFLASAEKTQEELHNTFEALHPLNKQIIISSDTNPDDLKNFEDRLKTRFSWGMSVQISPPDYDLKVKILKNKMAGHETAERIKPEVLEYIANNSQSDVRHLEGIINRLYVMIAMYQPEIVDLEFAQKYLKDDIEDNKYNDNSIEKIKRAVAEYYNVTVDTLKSKKRKAEINKARQIAIYLCTMTTDETVERIGLSFNRDHATVIHAREKITEDLKNSEQLKQEIKDIKDKI